MSGAADLRPYQQLAIEHTRRSIDSGNAAVYFSLPTGCGKTHVISQLAAGFDHTLLLAHRIELIDQLAARLRSDWPDRSVGIVRAERNEWDADMVVATPQTLRGHRLEAAVDRPLDAVFIDEAHHVTPGSRYHTIMEAAGDVPAIGCTATPFRADKRRMQDVLPTCTFSRTIDEMQTEGWLCPLLWHRIEVGMNLAAIESVHTVEGTDYRPEVLAAAATEDSTVADVIRQTTALVGDRPTAVFAVNVHHAQLLADAYENAGIRSEAVWGAMPKRRRVEILSAWRAGSVQVVANCGILTEGFDFPSIAALVMARPTRSPGLYMQMLGRGTRKTPGKEDCLVLDVTGIGEMDDSYQVVMPDMVSVPDVDVTQREPSPFKEGPDAGGQSIQQFRDPARDVVYRWIKDTGRYILPAADGVTMVIQSDPSGSGLYHLARLDRDHRYRLSRQPDTIWEQQRRAAVWLAAHAVPALSYRQQEWHQRAPTERQLRFLGQLDETAAAHARAEHWTRVETRDEITRLLVKAHEDALLTDLWRTA